MSGHDHHHHDTAAAMSHHEHTTTTEDPHGGHGGGGHNGGGMDHMMKMFFHFGTEETVLFEGWKFTTAGGLIGSMVGIFFMAALYEGLKYYREYLFWKAYNALRYQSVTRPVEKGTAEEKQRVQPSILSWMHAYQTCLHVVQIVVSYLLMLIFMTFNVWLCIAVVAGAAVGYFLFGWKKSVIVDVTEHCH